MTVQLNQTESERRMYRILYFVKYLRVMILNLLLSSIAVVLYLLFGITGIYPGAVDTINALRSQPTPNFYLGYPHANDDFPRSILCLAIYLNYASLSQIAEGAVDIHLHCHYIHPVGRRHASVALQLQQS